MSLEPPVEHKQVIIRAECVWFFPEESADDFRNWISALIEKQGMKIMSGPHVAYCNRPGLEGWSGTAIIETSHVAIHVWDKPKNDGEPVLVQLDFYTCGKLDVKAILDHLWIFVPLMHDKIVLDREYRLEVL